MKNEFHELQEVINTLFSENGCPWDKAQTFESLVPCLLEECYETVDAVNKADILSLKEEIGDVLLLTLLYSKIAENSQNFDFNDVCKNLKEKMILRHPHVFKNLEVSGQEEVLKNWENIKIKEKGIENNYSALKSVPDSLPALMKATKVLKKVDKLGISDINEDFKDDNIFSELEALKNADNTPNSEYLSQILGESLLKFVAISIKFKINPEIALTNALETYINRFVEFKIR